MSIEQQIDQEKVALSENEKRDSSKKLGYAVMLFVAYVLLAIFFVTQMIPPIPEGASDPIIKTTINIAIALFTPSLFLIASAAFFFSYKGEERDETKTAKHLSSSIKENKEKAQVITTKIVKNYNSIPQQFHRLQVRRSMVFVDPVSNCLHGSRRHPERSDSLF